MTARTQVTAPTALLADWSTALREHGPPPEIAELVKGLILDFVRAAVIGTDTPWGAAAREVALAEGAPGAATVLVYGDRLAPGAAAFANGCFAHAADIDDTHVGAMLHPGAAVLPAALATAQTVDASGRELIAAIVAGYEAAIRIALAVQPSHFHQGFQATGTCGSFGAALAAASVLGLDAGATAGALGVAGSSAGGLAQFYYSGSTVKRIHAGLAARNGVLAALLARAGIEGPHDILEGEAGFGRAYADGLQAFAVADGLGEEFRMQALTVKPHATSARVQAAVEAVLRLMAEHGTAAADVRRIEVGIPSVIAGRLTQSDPPDTSAAQMSLPFAVALAAVLAPERGVEHTLTVQDFAGHLDDAEVRRLAATAVCEIDDEVEALTTEESVPGKVALHLAGGQVLRRVIEQPLGSPGRPLTPEQWQDLFRRAIEPVSAPGRAHAVARCVAGLEEMQDMRELTSALAGLRSPS
jgi:2-methylcitrate dehydratase PrpD